MSEAKKVNKGPRTTVWNICKYVQDERRKSNESFDLLPENEHTFSTSYFHEKPLLNVETI